MASMLTEECSGLTLQESITSPLRASICHQGHSEDQVSPLGPQHKAASPACLSVYLQSPVYAWRLA